MLRFTEYLAASASAEVRKSSAMVSPAARDSSVVRVSSSSVSSAEDSVTLAFTNVELVLSIQLKLATTFTGRL